MAANAVQTELPALSRPSGRMRAGARERILVVEREATVRDYIRNTLESAGYQVTSLATGAELLARLQQGQKPDLVLLDTLVSSSRYELLQQIRTIDMTIPLVMLSCSLDPREAVLDMQMGVRDYLQKPFRNGDVNRVVARCLKPSGEASAETESQEIPLDENTTFVFGSKMMREIRAQCSLVARVDLPVLILGESGTGKEILAQFIHKMSPRTNRTFMKINCAAMPADLLESELFGYEQGAFTGATKAKPGKFELCNNGTILLDEIGEMPAPLQAKLLQVLQDGSFSRLGGRTTIRVDVRVIAATNIDMKAAIAQRRFREDLYYRLNGFSIKLPPLRERKEEIPILLRHFVRKSATKYAQQALAISPRLEQACMNYSWPGNLRELGNFVKRFLVLGDEEARIAELAAGHTEGSAPQMQSPQGGLKRLVRNMKDDAEAVAISQVLESTHWNRKRAAAELQISYKALLYKIKQYNLTPPERTMSQWAAD